MNTLFLPDSEIFVSEDKSKIPPSEGNFPF